MILVFQIDGVQNLRYIVMEYKLGISVSKCLIPVDYYQILTVEVIS